MDSLSRERTYICEYVCVHIHLQIYMTDGWSTGENTFMREVVFFLPKSWIRIEKILPPTRFLCPSPSLFLSLSLARSLALALSFPFTLSFPLLLSSSLTLSRAHTRALSLMSLFLQMIAKGFMKEVMTSSYICHNSSTCVSCLIHMCDMNRFHLQVSMEGSIGSTKGTSGGGVSPRDALFELRNESACFCPTCGDGRGKPMKSAMMATQMGRTGAMQHAE